MEEQFKYPIVGFNFNITFNGNFKGNQVTAHANFKEVSGLSVEVPVEEITEGGELRFRHRLPTTPKYDNLVLKRGLVINSLLLNWIKTGIEQFQFYPFMVNIALINEKKNPLMKWAVHNARPVKWSVSSFDAMKNEYVLETLELAFDYFETKSK